MKVSAEYYRLFEAQELEQAARAPHELKPLFVDLAATYREKAARAEAASSYEDEMIDR